MPKLSSMTIFLALTSAVTMPAWSAEPDARDKAAQEQVIKPEVDRKEIKIPKIDADDIEIGAYFGTLSVEDFGAENVAGLRVAYHVTEDIFIEAAYGKSKISDEQYRTILPGGIFPNKVEDLEYYNVSVGWHLLPGEVFRGKRYAFSSGVYVIGGIGQVEFVDVSATEFNFGLGVRILPWDWVAIRVELRDHIFDQDLLGKNKTTHNFELTLGLSAYF
jgi:outer membrane beta-barrel protein